MLCLISGGGSALLAAPAPGLTLDDKRAINRALLKSGADIAEMNCVRKHLSAIKGGRLALAAAPARVVGLVISDVPGDDLADHRLGADRRRSLRPPPRRWRSSGAIAIDAPRARRRASGKRRVGNAEARRSALRGVVQRADRDAAISLRAAAAAARAAGVTPVLLGDAIEGEAREVGKVFAGIARSAARHGEPARGPCVLLSGGETTVTVRGKGRGGRNAEFLLGLALALDGAPGIYALAGDTDGIDGSEDNAGAMSRPTRSRAPPRSASTPRSGSPTTTPIRCSQRSAISSSPARR